MNIKIDNSAIKKLDKIVKKHDFEKILRISKSGKSWGGGTWSVALDEQKENDTVIEVKGYRVVMNQKVYDEISTRDSINIYTIFSLFGCTFGVC